MTIYELVIDYIKENYGMAYYNQYENLNVIKASVASAVVGCFATNSLEVLVIR